MNARTISHRASRFHRSDDGVAALEFAMFAPVLSLLLLGGFDVARYIAIRADVDKVGFSVADVTAQYDDLTPAAMTQVFKITGSSLKTYVSGTNGLTILTSVYLDASGKPKVRWQCASSASALWPSKVGVPSGTAAVSAGLLADTNDNLMVAEVFYKFTPVFARFFKNGFDMYTTSIFRPRLGSLTTKPC